MKFKVSCGKATVGPTYTFHKWSEPLRGPVSAPVVLYEEIEKGEGRDGYYYFHFFVDSFRIMMTKHWDHDIPEKLFERKKAQGIFFEDYIKIHRKTLLDKLSKLKENEEIELTTWDQEYNQEAITKDLNEVRKSLNRGIEKRQAYGLREGMTEESGYILSWSNASASWVRFATFYIPGMKLKLDANQVYAPFTAAEIDAVIEDLAPLPLFAYSLEAKAAIRGRPKEELQKDLDKLEKELEIAGVEEDFLKQRNIRFTMEYIKSLLEQPGEHIPPTTEHIT